MSLPVYSSKDVKVAWGGITLDGLAPESFVTFQRNTDLTDEEVGADGTLSISVNPDRTGTCTISLQQNSEGNLILAGVLAAQEISGADFKTASLAITDLSGGVIAKLSGAHIKTSPEIVLGSTATGQTKDWVFFCEKMEFTSTPDDIAIPAAAAARILAGVETANTWLQ